MTRQRRKTIENSKNNVAKAKTQQQQDPQEQQLKERDVLRRTCTRLLPLLPDQLGRLLHRNILPKTAETPCMCKVNIVFQPKESAITDMIRLTQAGRWGQI